MQAPSAFFQFGEQRPEFQIPVLNERAVRASAGILFFLAMVSFMNAWLVGNFLPTRVFVLGFLVDFGIRLFVNPRFAPSLIVGAWAVRHQQPEWTGAPQKRFAWGIGFALALAMLYLLVIRQVVGPINLLVCGLCLLLMFFESAFGICLGCKLYNAFHTTQAQLCPGGACALPAADVPRIGLAQVAIVMGFAILVAGLSQAVYRHAPVRAGAPTNAATQAPTGPTDPVEAARCQVPAFAKAMGHEEKWKLHNNCPTTP